MTTGVTSKVPLVVVGIGAAPSRTVARLLDDAAAAGQPARYASYRTLETDGRVVRDAGVVLASAGRPAQFLFRGGGALREGHFERIAAVEATRGVALLNDLDFIRVAGSKERTFAVLAAAGAPLPRTVPVSGARQARAAYELLAPSNPTGQIVLKQVSSLGGRDVHFPRSASEAVELVAASDASWVAQEIVPAARDQDVRVHLVLDGRTNSYRVVDTYVRNRAPEGRTPNLANGGSATPYVLSPWEEAISLRAADTLAATGGVRPVHIGLDLFPRAPISAATLERNRALRAASPGEALLHAGTAVIGEAASSAGTKGTMIVRGGANPVTEAIVGYAGGSVRPRGG